MNLVRDLWDSESIQEFYEYEKTLKGDDYNCSWEQRIVGTKLECYARTATKARAIKNEIKKGNFLSFVDNLKIQSHFDSILLAYLICSIKNFDMFEERLTRYVESIDNWASADTLKFDKRDPDKLKKLSKKFLSSKKTFVRRVGVNIWFDLVKDKTNVDEAFKLLDSLKNETEYYVNMCGAWLLSDIMSRYRDLAIEYYKSNDTNSFLINKSISKCRDSFRVTREDKEELLKYKRKEIC